MISSSKNYCKYSKNKSQESCKKTKKKTEDSNLCGIHDKKGSRPKCYVIKRKTIKKTISPLIGLKCSNDEDPITFNNFIEDNIQNNEIISIALKNSNSNICFEKNTIWSIFMNHINHDLETLQRVSDGNYDNLYIDMSIWGITQNLIEIPNVSKFIKEKSKIVLKNKEYTDPNAEYNLNGNNSEKILQNFLMDRIDLKNDMRLEFFITSILGNNHEQKYNVVGYQWKYLIEFIHKQWIEPENNGIQYLSDTTQKARNSIMRYKTEKTRRLYFIKLIVTMYNLVLSDYKAEVARTKVQMLLWALQFYLHEY